MATLTERQEAIKAVLGSTDSIRKFVEAEGIHLEDLRTYVTNLDSVIKSLEEAEEAEAIESAKAMLEKARSILALKNFKTDRINEVLGIGKGTSTKTKVAPTAATTTRNNKKYIFPLADGKSTEAITLVGRKNPDSEVMKACHELGYKNLGEWVKADEGKTIKEA